MEWTNCPHCGDKLSEFMWCNHCGDITLLDEYQDALDAPAKVYTPADYNKLAMDTVFKKIWP